LLGSFSKMVKGNKTRKEEEDLKDYSKGNYYSIPEEKEKEYSREVSYKDGKKRRERSRSRD
jgi:hypothetical protein